MRANSRRSSISASSSRPGTGTSSTWCGCSCSPAFMCGDRARSTPPPDPPQARRRRAQSLYCAISFAERRNSDCALRSAAGLVAAQARTICDLRPGRRKPDRGELLRAACWARVMPDEEPSASPLPVGRGLAGRCPRCGKGKLFRGFLTLAPRCERCGLDYSFADSGDGPAVFVILIAGFIVVGATVVVEILYQPPLWLQVLILGVL